MKTISALRAFGFAFLFYCVLFSDFAFSEDTETEAEALKYVTPLPSGDVHFAEPFDAEDALDSWTLSKADKEGVESEISKYDGRWEVREASVEALSGDTGLVLADKARHAAISTSLDKPFVFEDKPFVLQYEVNFQDGIECGGAYVKLLRDSDDLKLSEFHDKTPYSIMFGPDKCGEDYKLHFIFQHKNPLTGEFEEKHAPKPTASLNGFYTDKKSHLYTLVINPDNTFKVYVDQKEVISGSLLTDMSPPVNPPKEIEDADDRRPEDWDERETIADESASKPEEWDEDAPATIPDPSAEMPKDWLESEPLLVDDPESTKPDDWDDEIDGEWEAPQVDNPACTAAPGCGVWEPSTIPNPAYKGKWLAPHIANEAYQGIWKPRMILNPGYFEDNNPFGMASIGALGFELWSMSNNIMFDNIIITNDKVVSDDFSAKTWALKKELIAANEPGMVSNLMTAAEERPWLWVIYVLVVGLPILLIFVFCFRSSSKTGSDADAKKTDAVSPDDPHDSQEEEEAAEEEQATAATDSQNEEVREDGGDGDAKDDAPAVTKNDLENAEDSQEEEAAAADSEKEVGDASEKKSPRRKPRIQD